jgi:hypothetical protein
MCANYVIAAALAISFATSAAAQGQRVYYVVQDPVTKKCTIVETKPAAPIGSFFTRAEAEAMIRNTPDCADR